MAEERSSKRGRRYRRRLRSDRGVVSVVGTLLALLVFFALFGIFITQYVPLWMTDNESQWTNQVQSSFATLKANMDLQVAVGNTPVLSTPMAMGSLGIPLIAQPTSGILGFTPKSAGVFANVSLSVGPGGGAPFYQNDSLGTLRMTEPNRYFSPQTFELENDAVIQSQGDTHQILAYPPPLVFNVSGTNVGATIGLFQLIGNATQAISTGTEEVYSHYLGAQVYTSNGGGRPFNAEFALGTHYECAWQAFLNQTIHSSFLPNGLATLTGAKGCVASLQTAQDLFLSLTGISWVQVVVATFQLVIGVGVE